MAHPLPPPLRGRTTKKRTFFCVPKGIPMVHSNNMCGYRAFRPQKSGFLQPDQINMAVLSWYLVKSDAIVYATEKYTYALTLDVYKCLQGTRNAQPCIKGHTVPPPQSPPPPGPCTPSRTQGSSPCSPTWRAGRGRQQWAGRSPLVSTHLRIHMDT